MAATCWHLYCGLDLVKLALQNVACVRSSNRVGIDCLGAELLYRIFLGTIISVVPLLIAGKTRYIRSLELGWISLEDVSQLPLTEFLLLAVGRFVAIHSALVADNLLRAVLLHTGSHG